ncbi:hypothetical protein [Brevundimonas sp.]|uniref:hypothetical protein n=1 Tax=Brevundimonas sp. TaxID=1871086 RepID=UPI0025BEEB4D|nr:hypothetical protein [Brevundimonas sp.]
MTVRSTRLMSVLACVALALGGCAASGAEPASVIRTGGDRVEAAVLRDGNAWTVTYRLNEDAPVWAFQRSALLRVGRTPWRPAWWSVQTPGVILDRQGRYDVLRTVDGSPVPRDVRIVMHPREGDLEADYDPALMFSDGTVALYSGQFDVIPLASVEEARALPLDTNGLDLPGGPARVRWRDRAGPVLFKGERIAEPVEVDADTYVLFGQAEVRSGSGVTTVIDPGLPTWLGQELAGFTPRVMGYYAERLGPSAGGVPTLMVSWTGPTERLSSMGGSVLPGLISMNFEGEGVLDPDAVALSRARWFIGHEAAHFWLGSNGLRYEFARDAWITEGGADLMAVRAISAIDPTYDARAELQREVDDCVTFATGKPVATAGERGDNRAYYACGAVWAMAFEAAKGTRDGGDWFDVIAEFQRGEGRDGVLSREEWLSALTRTARDPSLRLDIERMLDQGVGDPGAVIGRLFQRTGVAHRVEGGKVVLG